MILESYVRYHIIGNYEDKVLATDESCEFMGFLYLTDRVLQFRPLPIPIDNVTHMSVQGQYLLVKREDKISIYNLKTSELLWSLHKKCRHTQPCFNGLLLTDVDIIDRKVRYTVYDFSG
jgi:hypothetical protein